MTQLTEGPQFLRLKPNSFPHDFISASEASWFMQSQVELCNKSIVSKEDKIKPTIVAL